jgi:DNA-binding MarR family transcriptional regulator
MAIRARLLRDLAEDGFDIAAAHFQVMQYPPPDGVRPMEIAAKAHLSKQAANYLIAQLEARGYLERRTVRGKGRLVFLTADGHRFVEALHAISRDIEAEWQRAIGPERYREFRETLVRLGELGAG